MKRLIIMLLIPLLLLSGCSFPDQGIKDPVEFYYLRSCNGSEDFKIYFAEGAIVAESREASGHKDDLYYLLSMYLRGPLSPQMESPFPSGAAVTKVWQEGDHLYVNLNAASANAEDLQLTLVWACLAKTCMPFAGVNEATIRSGARTITINAKNVILYDATISDSTEGD